MGSYFSKEETKKREDKKFVGLDFWDAFYGGKCKLLRNVVGEPSDLACPAVKVTRFIVHVLDSDEKVTVVLWSGHSPADSRERHVWNS
jgi:hypothetical protein